MMSSDTTSQSHDVNNANTSCSTDIKKDDYEDLYTHIAPLEQIIFKRIEENFDSSVEQTLDLFDSTYPSSFCHVISDLIYFALCSKMNIGDIYIDYLEAIQTKGENNKSKNIIEFFKNYLWKINSQESYYLIEKMIEHNLIDASITENIESKYFAHYRTEKENKRKYYKDSFSDSFLENYEELSKNNWELHKQLIKEAVNPNEIAKIIRNDNIEKLQEISSQTNFDFNQEIKPSLYERYSLINHKHVNLIDYAAFFASIKCFKYLLMNGANVYNTGKYAVAGGNLEIIHLCVQNHSSFEGSYRVAIKLHKNDIFKYIYENKLEKLVDQDNDNEDKTLLYSSIFCVHSGNYEILSFLEKEGLEIENLNINESARIGNLYLVKYFLRNKEFPKNLLFKALESGNIELIKYVLVHSNVNLNETDVIFNDLKFVMII